MTEAGNGLICKAHSGFEAKINELENNVSKLWSKWDGMQKMVLGVFVTLSINLIGTVALLAIKLIK